MGNGEWGMGKRQWAGGVTDEVLVDLRDTTTIASPPFPIPFSRVYHPRRHSLVNRISHA